MKDFSSTMDLITECMKKGAFKWIKAAQRTFQDIKQRHGNHQF